MGSCPGYDPGDYSATDPELLGNPIVSDVFEPGSVMKAVTLSAAAGGGRGDAGHRAQRQRAHRGRATGW